MEDAYDVFFLKKLKRDSQKELVDDFIEENYVEDDYLGNEISFNESYLDKPKKSSKKSLNESIVISMIIAGGMSIFIQVLAKMWKDWKTKTEVRKVWLSFLSPGIRRKIESKPKGEQRKIFSGIFDDFKKEKRGATFIAAAHIKEKIKSSDMKKYWNQLVKLTTAGKFKKYGLPVLSVLASIAVGGLTAGILIKVFENITAVENAELSKITDMIKNLKTDMPTRKQMFLPKGGGNIATQISLSAREFAKKNLSKIAAATSESNKILATLAKKTILKPYVGVAGGAAGVAIGAIIKSFKKINAPDNLIKSLENKKLRKKVVDAKELLDIIATITKIPKEKVYTALAVEVIKYHGTLPLNNPKTPKAKKVFDIIAEFISKKTAISLESEFKKRFDKFAAYHIEA